MPFRDPDPSTNIGAQTVVSALNVGCLSNADMTQVLNGQASSFYVLPV
jgi:hypothetical protein